MIQILTGIQNTAAALSAEQTRLDVVSENIANANTSHGVDGKPYQRQVVVFESALQQAVNSDGSVQMSPIQVARIEKDNTPPIKVYEPGNPDADANGMVSTPNINVSEEMADLISASRTYEANLAVVKNARAMAMETLSIGKH
ncbi:MAG TPA: flagellar basal body rod protein FlgC [Candidatus Acidoferrales bacterium]|jgi:flagellar basal-body rod protein FlgC|nr:flagellar basal body rod protein FlgC [Candidatus Acidoferrales bacterium]